MDAKEKSEEEIFDNWESGSLAKMYFSADNFMKSENELWQFLMSHYLAFASHNQKRVKIILVKILAQSFLSLVH